MCQKDWERHYRTLQRSESAPGQAVWRAIQSYFGTNGFTTRIKNKACLVRHASRSSGRYLQIERDIHYWNQENCIQAQRDNTLSRMRASNGQGPGGNMAQTKRRVDTCAAPGAREDQLPRSTARCQKIRIIAGGGWFESKDWSNKTRTPVQYCKIKTWRGVITEDRKRKGRTWEESEGINHGPQTKQRLKSGCCKFSSLVTAGKAESSRGTENTLAIINW